MFSAALPRIVCPAIPAMNLEKSLRLFRGGFVFSHESKIIQVMNNTLEQDQVRRQVQERYGAIAQKSGSCCGYGPIGDEGVLECGTDAEKLGYSADDVVSVPEGSEMGLGCGNPTALASIKLHQCRISPGRD